MIGAPAVYSTLVDAFTDVSAGEAIKWYYQNENGTTYTETLPTQRSIEMLVPSYQTQYPISLLNGQSVTLTTADKYANDGFPYVGGDTVAQVTRGIGQNSVISVGGEFENKMTTGSLTLGSITLDGGHSNNISATVNGGLINVSGGSTLTVGTGATLQNSWTSQNGAAIYLAENSIMNISGAPVFSNNRATFSGDENATNGRDKPYTDHDAEQDIYIAGFANTTATSLVVTGKLTGTPGSIWVWAEQPLHYQQGKQFARLHSNIANSTDLGLDVFRNAQPDSQTGNRAQKKPYYLHGIKRGNLVYWSGTADLTVSKTVTGDFADPNRNFTFTVSGLTAGDSYEYKHFTSTGGENWTLVTSKLQPAVSTTIPEVLDENDDVITPEYTTGVISFSLKHNEKVVLSIPAGTVVVVTEEPGNYTPSYTISTASGAGTSGEEDHAEVTMNVETTVAFTNNLDPPAPTGVHFRFAPYALLLAAGLLPLALLVFRKRRRRGEA